MEHQLGSEENEVLYQRCMELVQEFTPEALDPARIAWWSSSQKEAHEVGSIKSVEHILQHANRLSSVSEDHLWHSLLAWAEFRFLPLSLSHTHTHMRTQTVSPFCP
mgnify:CR=1 FL=1